MSTNRGSIPAWRNEGYPDEGRQPRAQPRAEALPTPPRLPQETLDGLAAAFQELNRGTWRLKNLLQSLGVQTSFRESGGNSPRQQ
jgi:hypothetical protein